MRAPARSRDSAETEKIDEQKCRQGLGTTTKELVAESSPPVWTNWQHKTKSNVGLAGEGAEITERLKFREKPSNPFSCFLFVQ